MAKELIYLGRDDDCVRLALADLEDLSVRTVPVKKVLRTELNKLRAEGLQITGYVESDTQAQVTADTFVYVAEVIVEAKTGYSVTRDSTEKQRVRVFISGDGRLRCVHPSIYNKFSAARTLILRQRVKKLAPELLSKVHWEGDFELFQKDFGLREDDLYTEEYVSQYMLGFGLYSSRGGFGYLYFYPTIPDYTVDQPFRVNIPKMVLSVQHNFVLDSAVLNIRELHCVKRGYMESPCWSTVETLYANDKTSVHLTNIDVKRIVGEPITEVGSRGKIGQVCSGVVRGIPNYYPDLFKDAGLVRVADSFRDGVIEGDVVIPEDAEFYNCFENMTIKGNVICKKGAVLDSCFNTCKCENVFVEGDSDAKPWYKATIYASFYDTAITGNVDVSNTKRISHSFTGDIGGAVHFCPNLTELSQNCFTSYRDKRFTIKAPAEKPFHAGLQNKQAVLVVTGDKGSFGGVDVAELIWNTQTKKLPTKVFAGAKVLPTNQLLSVEETAEDAFVGYRGNFLDFRMFPNLKVIAPKTVQECELLSAVIVDGKVKLSPTSFTRCPKLAHFYIGDEVTGITASVFNNIAPQVHIYYGNNKAVERLARIPRFVLHPNSKPEDALAHLEKRAEMLETVEVIATFAAFDGINDRVNNDAKLIAQAVVLAMSEIGMCSDLATRYPVIPKCAKATHELDWVATAPRNLNYSDDAKREELVRLLVAMATLTYPFCDEVLNFAGSKGETVLESTKYAFIRSGFTVSGVINWAYVVVDKATDTIIHAFTFGGGRDELAEINKYLPYALTGDPCALLRYVEDTELVSWRNGLFDDRLYTKIKAAVCNSWLPFGSYKAGSRVVVYGVDLYSGDFVCFPYLSKTRIVAGTISPNGLHEWWSARLHLKGIRCAGDTSTLIPLIAGGADENLARYNKSSKLKKDTAVDTGRIPFAESPEGAQTLLLAFTQGKADATVKTISDLLVKSELYQKDNRLPFTAYFNYRSQEHTVQLADGKMTLYDFGKIQYSAAEVYNAVNNTSQWYVGVARVEYIKALLNKIYQSAGNPVDIDRNIFHYTVNERFMELDILPLTGKFNRDWIFPNYNRRMKLVDTSAVWLGVSPVSFKACLYFQKTTRLSTYPEKNQLKSIMFWFNSLKSAYKAAGELGFSPFAGITDTNTRKGLYRHLRADGFGAANSDIIRNTIRAIREGRPDGYILNDDKCSQVLFDLACKQPKNI